MITTETMTIDQADQMFDCCRVAECRDGRYEITGKMRSNGILHAIQPWDPAELVVKIVADNLQGWSDYTDFVRIETVDGTHGWSVMARRRTCPKTPWYDK